MVLELELEHKLLIDAVTGGGGGDGVAEEGEGGERGLITKGFVEEEAEWGEHDPQLLPAHAVLELAEQVAARKKN